MKFLGCLCGHVINSPPLFQNIPRDITELCLFRDFGDCGQRNKVKGEWTGGRQSTAGITVNRHLCIHRDKDQKLWRPSTSSRTVTDMVAFRLFPRDVVNENKRWHQRWDIWQRDSLIYVMPSRAIIHSAPYELTTRRDTSELTRESARTRRWRGSLRELGAHAGVCENWWKFSVCHLSSGETLKRAQRSVEPTWLLLFTP